MTLCDLCDNLLDMILDKPKCQEKNITIYKKRKRRCEDFVSIYWQTNEETEEKVSGENQQ